MMPENFFKRLVLRRCMNAYGQPALFNPCVSQSSVSPFQIAGVFTNRPQDVPLEDGGKISTNVKMFGVNLDDFAVMPKQDDQIVFQNVIYDIIDTRIDGQGGCDLYLREAVIR